MNIRHITEDDILEVENIGKDSLQIYKTILVVTYHNKLVGFIIGKRESSNFNIMSFAIDRNYRKHGFGKAILSNLEIIIKPFAQVEYLLVHTENINAISFYLKNGFKQSKHIPGYYYGMFKANSHDALMLVKTL